LGVGAVALGVGSYFGVHALSLQERSNSAFDGTHCTAQRCVDDWDSAKRAALYSDISLAVGLAAVGLGTYLVLTPSHRADNATTLKLSIGSSGPGTTLALRGEF
jgi:hypothetical protein